MLPADVEVTHFYGIETSIVVLMLTVCPKLQFHLHIDE